MLRSCHAEFLAYLDTDHVSKARRIGHGYRNSSNYWLPLLRSPGRLLPRHESGTRHPRLVTYCRCNSAWC
jgi:hypothetical protein